MPTGRTGLLNYGQAGVGPISTRPQSFPKDNLPPTVGHNPLDLMRAQLRYNLGIQKALTQEPVNQAWRASQLQRQVMFNDPRNSPSRSQFSQGYTSPFQYFAGSNTWQTPAGLQSRGRRATQPSVKFAGPRYLIPVQVPWG